MRSALAILALVCAHACSDPPDSTDKTDRADKPADKLNAPPDEPAGKPGQSPTANNPGAKPPETPTNNPSATPGFHLDADPEPSRPHIEPRRREAQPIDLVLRSTPSGATASIDGKAVGKTPAYWQGTADGRPRDVTFALPGYAVARYRFVPVRSGVVHGSLRRLVTAEPQK